MNDIGWAITQLKAGKRVRRKVWLCEPVPVRLIWLDYTQKGFPVLRMEHPLDTYVWQADQEDLLATDWEVVP